MSPSRLRVSLATQGALIQLAALLFVVLVALGGLYLLLRQSAEQSASRQTQSLAVTLSEMPEVRAAFESPDPTSHLQPIASRIESKAKVRFVVFMDPGGVRLTHPNPQMVGQNYVGDITAAVAGGEVTHIHQGTLGLSLRTVVPVHDSTGTRLLGLVAVGVELNEISKAVSGQFPAVIVAGLVGTILIGVATLIGAHRLGRATHGMAARELSALFEYYRAALHSIGEGLLLLDLTGKVQIINDEAVRLLGCQVAPGTPASQLELPDPLRQVLLDSSSSEGGVFAVQGRLVAVQKVPASFEGRYRGTVVILRDQTDLEMIAGERDAARLQAEALHTQAHESSNRLHTVVSLVELGEPKRAVDYALQQLNSTSVLLRQDLGGIVSPEVTALLLGKAAQAQQRRITLLIDPESELPADAVPAADAVLIIGNLIDNAFDAVTKCDPAEVWAAIYPDCNEVVIEVHDTGPGISPSNLARVTEQGFTTKGVGHGLGLHLVSQCVERLGGRIDFTEPPGTTVSVRIPRARL